MRLPVFLFVAAAILSVQGCDRSIDLSNGFDSSITIGDYFAKKLTTQRFILEDLVTIEEIIEMNNLDPDTTWETLGESEEPLLIPDITFGPFEMDRLGISEREIELLTGTGKLYIAVKAVSSLPMDIDIIIEFFTPRGTVRIHDDPITIHGIDNGGGTDPEADDLRIEITADDLRSLAEATGIGGNAFQEKDLRVKIRRDAYMELSFLVEKTGGIEL